MDEDQGEGDTGKVSSGNACVIMCHVCHISKRQDSEWPGKLPRETAELSSPQQFSDKTHAF